MFLCNLDAERDWGHAKDYVEGMWRILQQDTSDDYVLATGEKHSVREFVDKAFAEVDVAVRWEGAGVDEKGFDADTDKLLVSVDPRYFRPTEVDLLIGDSSKARRVLGWAPQTSFEDMVRQMVRSDLEALPRELSGRGLPAIKDGQ